MTSALNKLLWYRLKANFRNRRLIPAARAHPLVIIESIIKEVSSSLSSDFFRPLVFHIIDKGQKLKLKVGMDLPVEFFFFGCKKDDVESWRLALEGCFSNEGGSKNFELESIGPVEARSFGKLLEELPEIPKEGEICLEFLTPMSFKPPDLKRRTIINGKELIASFIKRYQRLFGVNLDYAGSYDDFEALPCYWHYAEMSHTSGSQPGQKHTVKGCLGNLYIKGRFNNILPFIILGTELHAGRAISFSQGYFRLHPLSKPFFDLRFPNRNQLISTTRDTVDRYDHALELYSIDDEQSFDEERFADALANELKNGTYLPKPTEAFLIPKKSGDARLIEKPSAQDMVVQFGLYKILEPVIDKLLEPESIGFRKGLSRGKAVELVRKAARDGYRFIIESDIEDFFPSVNLDKLLALIDRYLPERDVRTRALIERILRTGYTLEREYKKRLRGLAQGSPLSPLLANLYLDDFDERIKALGVRIIRYADDFIILTRTREEAEKVLASTEDFLSELDLGINKDKTAIKALQYAFTFLGIAFIDGLGELESDEAARRLKKPLYVTEPYLFVGLNGESVEIRRGKKLIDTVPLRRINEIILMSSPVLSTRIIRRCAEAKIPITITAGNGYFVTTIKPDSKRYYAISHAHSSKYYSLPETEKLCLAKELAAIKLENYITLFQSRYKKGSYHLINELEKTIKKIQAAYDVDQVRGLEGSATKKIYKKLNDLILDPAFHIKRRRRSRPDPINSLLNLGYYLLFSRINATVRAVGLDPYLGFLHSPEDNYESFVCDIEELFRSRIDRLIIRLINLRVISKDDFKKTEKGYYLKHEAFKRFLSHFERELAKKTSSRVPSLLDYIYVQITVIKKWVLDNQTLSFYRWKS